MPWTDDAIAQLRQLFDDNFTFVEIGEQLGRSKNSVLGKAFRLGLQRPLHSPGGKRWRNGERLTYPVRRVRKKLVSAVSAVSAAPAASAVEPAFVIPPDQLLPFSALEDHHCRYPVEIAGVTLFCAAARDEPLPYCSKHCSICFTHVTRTRAEVELAHRLKRRERWRHDA